MRKLLYNYALSHRTVSFGLFVCALDFKAIEILTFVLLDHRLILLNDDFIFDLTE